MSIGYWYLLRDARTSNECILYAYQALRIRHVFVATAQERVWATEVENPTVSCCFIGVMMHVPYIEALKDAADSITAAQQHSTRGWMRQSANKRRAAGT